jgi:hypothetical protein
MAISVVLYGKGIAEDLYSTQLLGCTSATRSLSDAKEYIAFLADAVRICERGIANSRVSSGGAAGSSAAMRSQ